MAERTSPTGRNLPAFHCQLLIALVLLCSVMGCRGNHNAAAEQEEAVDLQQIKDNGELVVLTLYSSTSYFIYRGQDMGFQLKDFLQAKAILLPTTCPSPKNGKTV